MPPKRNRSGFCVSSGAPSQGLTGVHLHESLGIAFHGGVWRLLCVLGQVIRWRSTKAKSRNAGCGSRGAQREIAEQNHSRDAQG